MKYLILLLMITMCACTKIGSVYNYKDSVVVGKGTMMSQELQLRIYKNNRYELMWLKVPIGEYSAFNVNDTIK